MQHKFTQLLKSSGHSVTRQRLAVFRYLQGNDQTTVAAIISHHQQMDQASVYRTLSLFKQLGVIQDIISGGQKLVELTDSFDSHHHHLSCSRCGKSVTFEDEAIEQQLDQLAKQHGIMPQSHQIEVSGVCGACAQAKLL